MHKLELSCRILLVAHVVISLLGYIAFFQTSYQLASPLIPSSTVLEIARLSISASFIPGILLIPSLLCYFFQKRTLTVVLSSGAIIVYYLLSNALISF